MEGLEYLKSQGYYKLYLKLKRYQQHECKLQNDEEYRHLQGHLTICGLDYDDIIDEIIHHLKYDLYVFYIYPHCYMTPTKLWKRVKYKDGTSVVMRCLWCDELGLPQPGLRPKKGHETVRSYKALHKANTDEHPSPVLEHHWSDLLLATFIHEPASQLRNKRMTLFQVLELIFTNVVSNEIDSIINGEPGKE